VLRSLRSDLGNPSLPRDPLQWRKQLLANATSLELGALVEDLWQRGIPVIHLSFPKLLKFQGMATIVDGRPVAILGTDHDAPARQAFYLAHEVGHLSNGDCDGGVTVVDEEDDDGDGDQLERQADAFASRVLRGTAPPLSGIFSDGKVLAKAAYESALKSQSDAGSVIWQWASGPHGDFKVAAAALTALYCDAGARRTIRHSFDERVEVQNASETDQGLLRCVAGGLDLESAPH
jgi:hypothetical protein